MSAKKSRKAEVLQDESQDVDSPNLSAIEKASFMEGMQLNYGNPLHSTAMEEDLDVLEEGQTKIVKDGGKDIPATLTTAVKQRRGGMKRKETERDAESEKEKEKKTKRTGGKTKTRPEEEGQTVKKKAASQGDRGELDSDRTESDKSSIHQNSKQPAPTANGLKRLVGKKPAKRRSTGQTSAARLVKNEQLKKGKKRKSVSGGEKSSDPQSQEESDPGTSQQRRMEIPSSDESVGNDLSWKPSPKKAMGHSLGRTRKSSAERSKSRNASSGSAEAEKASSDRRERRGGRGGTELEVVLDAFLDFCDQYKESVESKAVKQSIDSFSCSVKEQLLEKISSCKELRVLKRENAKVGSVIRTKTQRLLDAKHELMRAERQVCLLQKEKDQLTLRLADLKRCLAFLHDIRELNKQYLEYRHKHPGEKETYGASSLPALLLETKYIQTAEQQLRGINKRLEKGLKRDGTGE